MRLSASCTQQPNPNYPETRQNWKTLAILPDWWLAETAACTEAA
jgi:hypothetical protein